MTTQREREQRFLDLLWAEAAEAGLNQKELAAETGIGAPTLSRLRSGQMGHGRKGLSLRVLNAAVKRFPALAPAMPIELPIGMAIRHTGKERAS